MKWWAAPACADLAHQAAEVARACVAAIEPLGGPLFRRALGRAVTQSVLRARCQAPIAQVLLPRVRRWIPPEIITDVDLMTCIETAASEWCGTSPCHRTAWLRTIWDAWSSSWRRGQGRQCCRFCGRGAGDCAPHIWHCERLWTAASALTWIAPPRTTIEILGLVMSPRAPGGRKRAYRRPSTGMMLMTMVCDVYHKLAGASRVGDAQLRAATRHALRRVWPL